MESTLIRFLASYNDENIVLSVSKHDDIIGAISTTFNLVGNNVKLQVFDAEWRAWVNKSPREIKNGDKVKVMLKPLLEACTVIADPGVVPWFGDDSLASTFSPASRLPTEIFNRCETTSSGSDTSRATDQDSIETVEAILSDSTTISTDSDAVKFMEANSLDTLLNASATSAPQSSSHQQVSDNIASNRMVVPLKPWPIKFEIPFQSIPEVLRRKLEAGLYPDERQRRKIVQVLFDKMAEYVRYPTKSQYTSVAQALVERFPCLALTDIPSVAPHEYWKTKLSDKFRNERKHLVPLTAVQSQKGSKKQRMTVNTEDQRSIELHQRWMKEEWPKRNKNMKKMGELMELTYAERRRCIVEDRLPVKTIREDYPALFETEELWREFRRVTGTDVWPTLMDNLHQMAPAIIKFARKKGQEPKFPQSLDVLLTVEETKKTELDSIGAVFFLSKYLSTKEVLQRENEKNKDCNVTVPTLIWEGESPMKAEYTIKAENVKFANTNDIVIALGSLIAAYYAFNMEYPCEARNFLSFTEKVLLKLEGGKSSRAINNLLSGLKGL